MLALAAALFGGGPRSGAQEIGKPGQILLALELEHIVLLVRKHILAEARTEGREPLVDFGKACLGSRSKRGTRTLEHEMIALEHALLLGIETEFIAAGVEHIDAAK